MILDISNSCEKIPACQNVGCRVFWCIVDFDESTEKLALYPVSLRDKHACHSKGEETLLYPTCCAKNNIDLITGYIQTIYSIII